MKIICEYCGTQFDTQGVKVCPNCGASFANNRVLETKILHENKKTQLELEKKAVELEQCKIENARKRSMLQQEQQSARAAKVLKIGCVIPVICVALIFIIGVIVSIFSTMTGGDTPSEYHSTEVITEVIEIPVSVGLNEVAETSKYTIVCDKFEVIEKKGFTPAKEYQYMSFHLVVQNKSEDKINTEKLIDCLADGTMCEVRWDSDRKRLPKYLNKGIKADGSVCFEVPIDTKSFDIKYGDYVTIHIENIL